MSLIKYKNWNHLYIILNIIEQEIPNIITLFDFWRNIYENPNITENIILAHPEWFNDGELSLNLNISWQFILNHPDWVWNYRYIFEFNNHITWAMIADADIKFKTKFRFINNPNMTLAIYRADFKRYKKFVNFGEVSCYHKYNILRNACVGFDELLAIMKKFYGKLVVFANSNRKLMVDVYVKFPWQDYPINKILSDERLTIKYLTSIYDRGYRADDAYFYPLKFRRFGGLNLNFCDILKLFWIFRQNVSSNPNVVYDCVKGELYKWDVGILVKNHAALTVDDCIDIMTADNPDRLLVRSKNDFLRYIYSHVYMTPQIFKKYCMNADVIKYIEGLDGLMIHYGCCEAADSCLTWKKVVGLYISDEVFDYAAVIAASSNRFNKTAKYLHLVVVRRCFERWRQCARHAVETRENKAVYECCVHELKMRFRDAEKMTVCVREV